MESSQVQCVPLPAPLLGPAFIRVSPSRRAGPHEGWALLFVARRSHITTWKNAHCDSLHAHLHPSPLRACSGCALPTQPHAHRSFVIGDANVQIASISEELAKKTEDAARQQEEITHLLSQIVDLQKKAKAVRLLCPWLHDSGQAEMALVATGEGGSLPEPRLRFSWLSGLRSRPHCPNQQRLSDL